MIGWPLGLIQCYGGIVYVSQPLFVDLLNYGFFIVLGTSGGTTIVDPPPPLMILEGVLHHLGCIIIIISQSTSIPFEKMSVCYCRYCWFVIVVCWLACLFVSWLVLYGNKYMVFLLSFARSLIRSYIHFLFLIIIQNNEKTMKQQQPQFPFTII